MFEFNFNLGQSMFASRKPALCSGYWVETNTPHASNLDIASAHTPMTTASFYEGTSN